MKIGSIHGTSGKAIAPPGQEDTVGSLPIRRTVREGMYFMESAWYPTPQELEMLQEGQPIILSVSAPAHPVVSLYVEQQPEVIGISAIDGHHPLARRVVVWDEIADQPLQNCKAVDCEKGIAYTFTPNEPDSEERIEGVYTIRTTDHELIKDYREKADTGT